MNLLTDLSLGDLDVLSGIFAQQKKLGGLNEREFIDAITSLFKSRGIEFKTEEVLKHMFASIDTFGEGRISWESFSMYCIELNLRGRPWERKKDFFKPEKQEVVFCPYRLKNVTPNPAGTCVTSVRTLPAVKKVVKVIKENTGQGVLELREATRGQPLRGVIPPQEGGILAWDYIPLTPGVPHSNSIACSYHGGFMRLFTIEKSYKLYPNLREGECINLGETQNSLRWVTSFSSLAMGSRSGVVSLWDTCGLVVMRKRIFYRPITSIQTIPKKNHMLYVASVDPIKSVKCFDFERKSECFSFNDHKLGGALIMERNDNFLFSVGQEPHIVQRPIFCPNVPPILLYDRISPHKGRITSLECIKGMPFLVSGDVGGNIKFWDIRMGACLQTIPSLTAPLLSRNAQMSLDPDDAHGYIASSIHSICHIDTTDELSVTTAREQLMFSAKNALHPELVDDSQPCRFVFFLNSEDIITVHEKGAKLWNGSTGILVESKPNMVQSDITVCCTVVPLNRQILVGTMEGELIAFSVSLLYCTMDLTPVLRKFIQKAEIVFLDVIQKYRDLPSAYALVVSATSILLVPLRSVCSAQFVVQLQGVKNVLSPGQTIQTAAVTPSHIIIATSNGALHIVDYQQSLTVTHTFTFSSAVEAITARPSAMSGELKPVQGAHKVFIVFLVDKTGSVHIAVLRTVNEANRRASFFSRRRSSVLATPRFEIIGGWVPSSQSAWTAASPRARPCRDQSVDPAHSMGRSSGGRFPFLSASVAFEQCAPGLSAPKSLSLSCGMDCVYTNLRAAATSALLFVLLDRYGVVATVDEERVVKLWDVREHMAQCRKRSVYAGAPVLLASWRLPGGAEAVFLGAAEHPALRLPLLLLATAERRVSLWTPDGAPLGALATGRGEDEATGTRCFGLPPYTVAAESTTPKLWENFLAVTQREAQENSPAVSVTSNAMLRAFPRRATKICKQSCIEAEKSAGTRLFFPSIVGAQAMQRNTSVDGGVPESIQRTRRNSFLAFAEPLDGDIDGSEEHEYNDIKEGSEKNENGNCILKSVHRALVTRRELSLSLGRIGASRLPRLKKLPQEPKR